MAIPSLGHKSYVQFAVEATYGTAIPATNKLGFITENLKLNRGVFPDPTLADSPSRRNLFEGGRSVEGQINTRWDYNDKGITTLLDMLMGTAAFGSAGGTTTGPVSTVYTHTFIERSILNSATFQIGRGDVPTGKVYRALGCKMVGLTLKGEASRNGEGLFVQATWDVAGQDMESDQTPTGALTVPTPTGILMHDITTKDDGTADAAGDVMVKRFELTIQNAAANDRFEGGSKVPREPLRNDFLEVRLKLRKEYQTKTLFDAMKAYTAGSPKIVFTKPGGTAVSLELDIGTAYIDDGGYEDGVSGYGIQFQEVTWRAIYDATNLSALKAIVKNQQATIL